MSFSLTAHPGPSLADNAIPLTALDHDAPPATRRDQHDRVWLQAQQTATMSSGPGAGVDITTGQRMISATWGSVLTSLLVTPLDVVRVRLQSQPPPAPSNLSRFPAYSASFKQLPPDLGVHSCCREVFWVGNNGQFCLAGSGSTPSAAPGAATATAAATTTVSDCAVEETRRRTFNSTLDGLRKIARNEGYLTLWRGLSPTLAMAIPANVIYFTGYDWLRYSAASPVRRVSRDVYAPLVAGSMARVAAAIAVSPIEMFRTRMQATHGSTTGVFRETLWGLHRMTQTHGYASLWRGLTLTMWRDVPFSGIYWWGYEAIRHELTVARDAARRAAHPADAATKTSGRDITPPPADNHTIIFVDSFVAGAGSGAIAALVTTPFDVGKTRQQVYRHVGEAAEAAEAAAAPVRAGPPRAVPALSGHVVAEELSMPRFLYHIFKEEGMHGLFKGWAARCLKVAPACAIMISSYEVGKKWAKKMNEKKEHSQT